MPRCGRLRYFIREYKESPRFEKLSFIPPFLILFLEVILILHAFTIDHPDIMVVELTSILLVISIIEIIFVSGEIHEHYHEGHFERVLTIKLDDFIIERKENNVKKIISDFIKIYPEYNKHRNKIYHITCQILETHKEEEWDEDLNEKLKKYISENEEKNVDELLYNFIKKYPSYKKNSGKIYEKICQLKADLIK